MGIAFKASLFVIPTNDPISVALDLDGSAPRKRVTFEDLVAEDEIDVPDFMK